MATDLRSRVFAFNPIVRKLVKIEKAVSETEREVLEFLIKVPTALQRDQIISAMAAGTDKTVKTPTLALTTACVLCTYEPNDADKRVFSDGDIEMLMNLPDDGLVQLLGSEILELMSAADNHAKKL